MTRKSVPFTTPYSVKHDTKYVWVGSWLCKNAKTLNRDRRSCSSKTALVLQLASEFNLEAELKNIILVAFRFFEFLHSQGREPTGGFHSAS